MLVDELRRTWGVAPSYALWQIPIRILFLVDGRITLDRNFFGLVYVLETLTSPFSFYVRFEVDVAKRDGSFDQEQLGSHQGAVFQNFKFTDASFDIDRYDQIWFFGDRPQGVDNVADDAASDSHIDHSDAHPLGAGELTRVAEWMDRGGGVFATGDHGLLGASMCSRIPRVRSMRRWKRTQHVPTRDGSTRHQTLQQTAEGQDAQEGDTVLQPIELVYREVAGLLPFLRPPMPHPLLCSVHGAIDRFPDHMHEGEVIADEHVQLDAPLDIPDYDRPEYPFVIPEVLASVQSGIGELRQRPRPHVIAYGRTTNFYFLPPTTLALSLVPASLPERFGSKRFGLIGVYDGDAVGLGRVVVDSTWHHWFSMNLDGIATSSDALAYLKMQAYYRNVGQWLARPSQRRSMLVSGTWGALIGSAPMEFDRHSNPWHIGERVLQILERTTSRCMLGEIVAPFLDVAVLAAASPSDDRPQSEPSWGALPAELVQRALVGGIGSALLKLALEHRDLRAHGQRPRLNVEALRRSAAEGASRGRALLLTSVSESVASLGAIQATLEATPAPRLIDVAVPVEIRRLRVVAKMLQLPDLSDPALMGRGFTITIRVKLDDHVAAYRILEHVELPALNTRGALVDLGLDAGVVEVQTGESLSIELLAGSWATEKPHSGAGRFSETLRGDASRWLGEHVPGRSQAWRLWYRIEKCDES
jgi:hypothetical protein